MKTDRSIEVIFSIGEVMKQVKKLDKELFDSNTKFVSIGTLNEDKIAFISDIDSDIAKKLRPSSDILFWENRIKHTERHKDDFLSDTLFDTCFEDIPSIIESPDYIGVHPKDNSLLFIKDYSQHISVAVRVATDGKMGYRTMFPLMEAQLDNYIKKKRVKKFNT